MNRSIQMFKLASDPRQPGLACLRDGLALAGHPLLFDSGEGLSPRSVSDIQEVLDAAYGWDADIKADDLMPGLASVARFLNKGDLALAMIGSVLLRLPDIPDSSPLAKAARDRAAKTGYDPAQPRDDNGRWTQGAGSGAFLPPAAGVRPSLPDAPLEAPTAVRQGAPALLETGDEAAGGILESLAPEALALLARLAPYLGGAVATAVGVLIPTNRSNIRFGNVPDAPGLTYRSDEGVVTIFSHDSSGNPIVVYHSLPDRNGFYYDDKGLTIGRAVGTAVLFDSEALQDMAAEKAKPTDSVSSSVVAAHTVGTPDEEPRFCPPPTPESTAGRSRRSIAYQSQITGLPENWDVLFQGVRYDGCVEPIKHLQEAKGPMGGYLERLSDDDLRKSKSYGKIMNQAKRQNDASGGFPVDWYFADERFYRVYTEDFHQKHFTNIFTHYVEAIVKKFQTYLAYAP